MGHRPKALLRRNGEPLWLALLQALHAQGVGRSVVVTGHHRADVVADIEQHRAHWPHPLVLAHNPTPDAGPQDGLPGSLVTGLRACPAGATVWVLLADLVALQAADLAQLRAAHAARPPQTWATVPSVHGTPGHPVVLSAAAVQALLLAAQASPDFAGFKAWRTAHPQLVHLHATDNPHFVADADTPDTLQAWAAQEGLRFSW